MATRIGERDQRIRCQYGYTPHGFGVFEDTDEQEKIQRIKELKNEGKSHGEIAVIMGLSRSHVDVINQTYIYNAKATTD